MGLFSEDSNALGPNGLTPREMMIRMVEPTIRFDHDRDLVVLLVEAETEGKAKKRKYRALLIDRGDPRTGFNAMERTTGFPTAFVAHLQAQGKIPPGATPIERCVPLDELTAGLKKRGLKIRETLK